MAHCLVGKSNEHAHGIFSWPTTVTSRRAAPSAAASSSSYARCSVLLSWSKTAGGLSGIGRVRPLARDEASRDRAGFVEDEVNRPCRDDPHEKFRVLHLVLFTPWSFRVWARRMRHVCTSRDHGSRVDAQGSDDRTGIGGWFSVVGTDRKIDVWSSLRCSLESKERGLWEFEKEHRSSPVISILEALATTSERGSQVHVKPTWADRPEQIDDDQISRVGCHHGVRCAH